MENLFVRILNVTLLVVGSLALIGTAGAVLFLCLSGYPALFAETGNRQLAVTYQPLSVVSGSATLESKAEDRPVDKDLRHAAVSACNAENRMIEFLSNNRLERTVSDCISSFIDGQISDRATNSLQQLAVYMDAARADPQIRSKYPPTVDKDSVGRYIAELEEKFNVEFAKAAELDDERKAKATMAATEAKTYVAVWGASAASMFISFLFIAFLIVAIRIEKHLGNVERKLPSTP